MRTIKTTTGEEVVLDGDLLAIMEALYREHILKEPKPEPQGGFIPLGAIAPAAPKAEVKQEKKEEVFGD